MNKKNQAVIDALQPVKAEMQERLARINERLSPLKEREAALREQLRPLEEQLAAVHAEISDIEETEGLREVGNNLAAIARQEGATTLVNEGAARAQEN